MRKQKTKNYIRGIIDNIRRTLRVKLLVLTLILIGVILELLTNDATVLVLILMFVAPLFFAKEDWIYE